MQAGLKVAELDKIVKSLRALRSDLFHEFAEFPLLFPYYCPYPINRVHMEAADGCQLGLSSLKSGRLLSF